MGQLTISMAIFNSFLYVYQRVTATENHWSRDLGMKYRDKKREFLGYWHGIHWNQAPQATKEVDSTEAEYNSKFQPEMALALYPQIIYTQIIPRYQVDSGWG
jgi:hypothetical protein